MDHTKTFDPALQEEDELVRLIERPEGYYWKNEITEKLDGPFATILEAMEDGQSQDDSDYEEGQSLYEAETELGIADWIDPDTGELAEDSAPHLSDE